MPGVERDDKWIADDLDAMLDEQEIEMDFEVRAAVTKWAGEFLAEHLGNVWRLEVPSARVAVETVHAYGLELDVDANGRAAAIEFPDPAEVVG